MSRYAVNKVLWQIGRNDDLAAEFVARPGEFLAGQTLTAIERRQLADRDLAGLFAAGAHPFLLYTFHLKMSGGWSFPMMVSYVNALEGVAPPLDIAT